MRERNGIDAARTIWSERPETRILFWSNYADEAYLRGLTRIVPVGSPYGYVLKTAPVQRLHLAMRAVLVEGRFWSTARFTGCNSASHARRRG